MFGGRVRLEGLEREVAGDLPLRYEESGLEMLV